MHSNSILICTPLKCFAVVFKDSMAIVLCFQLHHYLGVLLVCLRKCVCTLVLIGYSSSVSQKVARGQQ